MNMRLKKVLDDIQKTENKILELQEHVRQLRIQKKQMEDAEIIKAIRSMKMDSRKMLTFLDGIQNGTVTMQFDEEGNLEFKTSCDEGDLLYDEIGCGLKIRELQRTKEDLLRSLEMYYKVLYVGI